MNLCFFSGNINSEPNFKFLISKNMNFKDCLHISVCRFELKIDESTVVIIKAYDDLADYCYSNFKRGDYITVSGRINDINEVEIDFCKKLQ